VSSRTPARFKGRTLPDALCSYREILRPAPELARVLAPTSDRLRRLTRHSIDRERSRVVGSRSANLCHIQNYARSSSNPGTRPAFFSKLNRGK
jgi:hypothetical protein